MNDLYVAAETGNLEMIQRLLQHDGNRAAIMLNDATHPSGATPVFMAVVYGHVACVEALIRAGADVNLPDVDGTTPVVSAAYNGHVECIKVLIDAGADVEKCDGEGWTALLKAASSDRGWRRRRKMRPRASDSAERSGQQWKR